MYDRVVDVPRLLAGYRGGWVDSLLMRCVDILYGLPYILLVILFKIAFEPRLTTLFGDAQVVAEPHQCQSQKANLPAAWRTFNGSSGGSRPDAAG